MAEESHLRIGELSRRTGVSPELLRAWERRYDLLRPTRSPGGLRLYSVEDLERVRLMSRHIADGVSAREAAGLAARAPLGAQSASVAAGAERAAAFDARRALTQLARAVESFDEPATQATIDELLSAATIDAVLSEVVVPFLHDVGDRWQRGELSVEQEHFASNVLRGRLLGLGRGWGAGSGPRALLACPPGERHDLGLIAFGLALRARGWRIDFLGSDTPAESIVRAARTLDPALVVVSATAADLLRPVLRELAALAPGRLVATAGAGARELEPPEGVTALAGDPVGEAARVTELAN
jgi:MerR family transcriptional regulator, light-induced transcriptional regulator